MTVPDLYQRQDAVNTLYTAAIVTASGFSSEIDRSVIGGFLPCEAVLSIGDLEGTATLVFTVQDYISGAYQDTPYQLSLNAAGNYSNGVYRFLIDPRIVKGPKMRLKHTYTAGTDSDGVVIAGHIAPMSLWAA